MQSFVTRYTSPLLCSLVIFLFSIAHVQAKEISVVGSTSVARVMDVLAETYSQQHPDHFVAVQGIGSTAGVTMVNKGVADIGMTSRYLTERENHIGLTNKVIAFDGLAVVVNPSNPVKNLTRDQLFNIYQGKVNNWKQVGGKDQPIAVVTREASSGTRYSFESLLGLTKVVNDRLVSDINPSNFVVNSNSMVKTLVHNNQHAIGFISTGSIDHSVKAISFNGIKPTEKNISNGQYQLQRPFILLYYPKDIDQSASQFIDYVLSKQGQQLITEYGYIGVNQLDK